MTRRGHRIALLALYALLAAAALALPLAATQPFHVHHGDTPGLYNGECALAVLAAFQGAAPLPSAFAPGWSGHIAGPALPAAAGWLALAVARHTDPRAPPLA